LWRVSCLLRRFWPVLFKIWSSSLVPDLHSSGVYFMTRASSGVHRRRPLQLPEAQATAVLGSRRVDGTRLNACRSSAHVLATFHFFWPCTALVGVYGGRSSAGWYRGQRVSSMSRRLLRIPPLSYCRQLLWVFLFSVYISMCLLWITVCLFVMHKCSWAYLVSG
jgi:hypothetical protein